MVGYFNDVNFRKYMLYMCASMGHRIANTKTKLVKRKHLENNGWFSAVLLCIYGDNHARVVPYFDTRRVKYGTTRA